MQLLLTDRLTCPRCGPTFGLILLADRMSDRRVRDGRLGCPNCRDSFPIVDGFADLRAPPRGELGPGLAGEAPGPGDLPPEHGAAGEASPASNALPNATPATPATPDAASGGAQEAAREAPISAFDTEPSRMIALLGIPRGPGTVALVGWPARFAAALLDTVEDLEVVAVDADTRSWPERPGISRLVSGPGLPFFDRTLRGVVADARSGSAMVFEAARVTAPMSRVVVVHATSETAEVLREAGMELLAEDGRTVVAARA